MPTTQLQPGSTNAAAVKQLQDYLVAQGFMTEAQKNTGYGTYGPQTTAAVAEFQSSQGVDTSGGGVGYWGPKTIAKLQAIAGPTTNTTIPTASIPGFNLSGNIPVPSSDMNMSSTTPTTATVTPTTATPAPTDYPPGYSFQKPGNSSGSVTNTYTYAGNGQWNVSDNVHGNWPSTVSTSQASPPVATPDTATITSTDPAPATGQGVPYDPSWAARGITQDQWNSLNSTQQATIGAVLTAGNAIVANTGHSVTMADALAAAATDPNIVAKYADAYKLDTQQFQQSIQQIQTATSTDSQSKQMQFESDRKALAEQSAAAGQAYSGYRGKAEQNLATSESGIVTSSRAALQKQLDDATSAFEAKYGTGSSTAATATFINPFSTADTTISGLASAPSPATPESLSGTLAGGITGSQPIAKQQDINTLAGQYVSLGAIPNVIPA